MMQEDLTMKAVNDSANHQTLLYGMGDQHIDIIVSKLLERYKVEVELSRPKVAFRETIRKNSDVEAKYKKQSGGHGQYGHVKMRFSASGDLQNHTFSSRKLSAAPFRRTTSRLLKKVSRKPYRKALWLLIR